MVVVVLFSSMYDAFSKTCLRGVFFFFLVDARTDGDLNNSGIMVSVLIYPETILILFRVFFFILLFILSLSLFWSR